LDGDVDQDYDRAAKGVIRRLLDDYLPVTLCEWGIQRRKKTLTTRDFMGKMYDLTTAGLSVAALTIATLTSGTWAKATARIPQAVPHTGLNN
jgi:hypothetical protein